MNTVQRELLYVILPRLLTEITHTTQTTHIAYAMKCKNDQINSKWENQR